MAQYKIYSYAPALDPRKALMSDVIHACSQAVLELPEGKRAHRFFPLARDDFFAPDGRTDDYTILEVNLFEGRTVATKKALYRSLYESFERRLGIAPNDLEIILVETPRHDWGIRGLPGDEIADLTYRVDL